MSGRNGFDLQSMVDGVIKTAQAKLAEDEKKCSDCGHVLEDGKCPKCEAASAAKEAPAPPAAEEAEKTAAALDYLASAIERGALVSQDSELSIEKIAEAYDIVTRVESDPRVAFKIKLAMAELPNASGSSPGIGPNGGAAMAHDLNDVPGGGGTQQRSTASAPSALKPPMKAGVGPGIGPNDGGEALATDLEDVPGGGGAYPESGVIRSKEAGMVGKKGKKAVDWLVNQGAKRSTSRIPWKSIAKAEAVRKGRAASKIKGYTGLPKMAAPNSASSRIVAMGRVMRKMAGDAGDGSDASLPTGGGQAPLGDGTVGTDISSPASHPGSLPEIASSSAAIDYTKATAKKKPVVVQDLGKVLSHPAMSSKHDDVMQKNLSRTEVSKLARRELMSRVLGGELDAGELQKLAGVEERNQRTINFKQSLEEAARTAGEKLNGSSMPVEMPGSNPSASSGY